MSLGKPVLLTLRVLEQKAFNNTYNYTHIKEEDDNPTKGRMVVC